MKAFAILAIVACSLLVSGCVFVKFKDGGFTKSDKKIAGNGVISEKTFEIGDFSRIKMNVPADVDYSVADTPSMVVKLDENLMEYLTVEVEDGVLKVGSSLGSMSRFKKLYIRLTSSALSALECNGAVDFTADGPVSGESFTMKVNGAADVEMKDLDVRTAKFEVNGAGDLDVHLADAEEVSLTISGAGDATLSGKAGETSVEINGAGDVDLTGLDYTNLVKKVNGIGSVKTGKKKS